MPLHEYMDFQCASDEAYKTKVWGCVCVWGGGGGGLNSYTRT